MLATLVGMMGYAFAATFAIMFLVWLVQLRTKNAGVVDIVWGISFPLSFAIYLIFTPEIYTKHWIFFFMVLFWGGRLAWYLGFRNIGKPEDERYRALRQDWGKNANARMLMFFLFQAILAVFLSFIFAIVLLDKSKTITYLEYIAMGIWLIGFVGESVADFQLKQFKSKKENHGMILKTGLWQYSRHPNYFCEWLIWLSYFVFALGSSWGCFGIVCPLLMYYFLVHVTGIQYTETQMLLKRGDAFKAYQKEIPAFFPKL